MNIFNLTVNVHSPGQCEVKPHVLHKLADVTVKFCPLPLPGNHTGQVSQGHVEEGMTKQVVDILAVWHAYRGTERGSQDGGKRRVVRTGDREG